jgi:hypothetical protein
LPKKRERLSREVGSRKAGSEAKVQGRAFTEEVRMLKGKGAVIEQAMTLKGVVVEVSCHNTRHK